MKTGSLLAVIVFVLAAIAHLLRVVSGTEVVVGGVRNSTMGQHPGRHRTRADRLAAVEGIQIGAAGGYVIVLPAPRHSPVKTFSRSMESSSAPAGVTSTASASDSTIIDDRIALNMTGPPW